MRTYRQNCVLYLLLDSFLNLKFFYRQTTKTKALICPENCCSRYVVLTILNYISFKCFKSALLLNHVWVCGF